MALTSRVDETLIHQSQHPFHGKAAGFRTHDGRLDPRLATACGNGFCKEHNRPNHFVIVLNVVDKSQLVLRKLLRSRHAIPPSRDRTRRTTADARLVADLPLAGRWRTCGQRCMRRACIVSEQRGKTMRWKLLYTTKIGCIVDTKEGRRPWSGRRNTVWPRTDSAPPERAPTLQPEETPPEKRDGQRTPFDHHQSTDPSSTGDAPRSVYRPSRDAHGTEGPSWDDCPPGVRTLSGDA